MSSSMRLRKENAAQDRGQKYDRVVCVFDAESEQKRASLNRAIQLAASNGIDCCICPGSA